MKNVPSKVDYSVEEMIHVIKEVNYVLFSIRDIYDASIDDEEFNIAAELKEFIDKSRFFERFSELRMILEDKFDDFPRDGDLGFLEKEIENINFWKVN